MVPLMIAGKVVGLGFEIIFKLDSYFLMTAQRKAQVKPNELFPKGNSLRNLNILILIILEKF